jgi:hypothetical protein
MSVYFNPLGNVTSASVVTVLDALGGVVVVSALVELVAGGVVSVFAAGLCAHPAPTARPTHNATRIP